MILHLTRAVATALLVVACAIPAVADFSDFSGVPVSSASVDRCRDCPFPMKVGDNKWLMPDSPVIVQIYEQQKIDASFQMVVTLMDSRTSEVLATGTSRRLKYQRSIAMTLLDTMGRRIEGDIFFVDRTVGTIQARFSCADGPCVLSN